MGYLSAWGQSRSFNDFAMKKCFWLIALPVLLFSCKGKKLSLAVNDEKVNIPDFLALVQPIKLPYEVTDTILRRKEVDATLIN